jgi:small subunit ribosomal protein S6
LPAFRQGLSTFIYVIMTSYELALLVKPLLPEDIKNKVVKEIETTVTKLEGKMSLKEDWGKRHLAYPIKGHQEGHYLFYKVELDGKSAKQVQDSLKLIKDVLRFLLIREDEL